MKYFILLTALITTSTVLAKQPAWDNNKMHPPTTSAERIQHLKNTFSKNKSLLHLAIMEDSINKVLKIYKDTTAKGGKKALIKLLNSKDSTTQMTPFHTVAYMAAEGNPSSNNFEIAMSLIQYRVDPNIKDSIGFTPLHYTMAGKDKTASYKLAKYLIRNGANMNLQARQGWTPLHYAVMHDNIKGAQILVARGANYKVRDKGTGLNNQRIISKKPRTAAEYALEAGNINLARIAYPGLETSTKKSTPKAQVRKLNTKHFIEFSFPSFDFFKVKN